ncbi:Lrp/AsnC family transcriptional regulator [Haladaptatus halobius]|uniref:Lrp/AsnC family transcriptional regulator n=1 Tax=Haladaptatus halobius TaxID=2884875 RepID=UPI001D0B3C41|nr:Lrp/AsnC family transcriptional regulator [Haladaptatus halobius]
MKNGTLDKLDKLILYELQKDARHTSSNDIAERMDVSSSTVRNRIKILEDEEIIRGYDVDVDYEKVGYDLYALIICTAPIPKREQLAKEAREVPGVVKVREIMTGEENIHIAAVGSNKGDLSRIGRDLNELGLDVADEDLIYHEFTHALHTFNMKIDDIQ